MEFSSLIFMFLFLPVFLFLFFILKPQARHSFLLIVSLVFYYWGDSSSFILLLLSIAVNYILGHWIDRITSNGVKRVVFYLAITFNLGLLLYYKYFDFILTNLNNSPHVTNHHDPIHLPLGISFFTFQALSAIIDIYRKTITMDKNPIHFGLYMAFFPKLVNGPITPYHNLSNQIATNKNITTDDLIYGFQRLIIGLGKKIIISDTLAKTANAIFTIPATEQTAALAWLGIVCFTLQIYFDFSGYTDMAIGIARLMGFTLGENFNYPYMATSIKEFWRRWHISLTTWLRDYLFLPIAYAVSRKIKAPRFLGIKAENCAYFSGAVITFFICGLWHGANWTFIVWGTYYGLLLVIEHAGLGKKMRRKWPVPVQWFYCQLLVMVGWVFFRSPNLAYAFQYLKAMAGFSTAPGMRHYVALHLNAEVLIFIMIGLIGMTPLFPKIRQSLHAHQQHPDLDKTQRFFLFPVANLVYQFYLTIVLFICTMMMAGGTFNPFLYFGF